MQEFFCKSISLLNDNTIFMNKSLACGTQNFLTYWVIRVIFKAIKAFLLALDLNVTVLAPLLLHHWRLFSFPLVNLIPRWWTVIIVLMIFHFVAATVRSFRRLLNSLAFRNDVQLNDITKVSPISWIPLLTSFSLACYSHDVNPFPQLMDTFTTLSGILNSTRWSILTNIFDSFALLISIFDILFPLLSPKML